jgi:hypothetical protein
MSSSGEVWRGDDADLRHHLLVTIVHTLRNLKQFQISQFAHGEEAHVLPQLLNYPYTANFQTGAGILIRESKRGRWSTPVSSELVLSAHHGASKTS